MYESRWLIRTAEPGQQFRLDTDYRRAFAGNREQEMDRWPISISECQFSDEMVPRIQADRAEPALLVSQDNISQEDAESGTCPPDRLRASLAPGPEAGEPASKGTLRAPDQ